MPSLAGKVAFSITWAQLDALRGMPKSHVAWVAVPAHLYRYPALSALIDKGLVHLSNDSKRMAITQAGVDLLAALLGLVPPKGDSQA
jgi:hypothetical protein